LGCPDVIDTKKLNLCYKPPAAAPAHFCHLSGCGFAVMVNEQVKYIGAGGSHRTDVFVSRPGAAGLFKAVIGLADTRTEHTLKIRNMKEHA